MAWSPSTYLRFAKQRLWPAVDLIAAIECGKPVRKVVDLGAGAGSWNGAPAARAMER